MAARNKQASGVKKLPDIVSLPALGEKWRIACAPLVRERIVEENDTLTLTSDFSENEALIALNRWLHAKACAHLPKLLEEEARRYRFSYVGVAVKKQKSRWGSCSSKGNINLNSRLLFLPPHLVKHLLLHELCHLKEMNHAKAFHDLLSGLDPYAAQNAADLRRAWSLIPSWAE